MLAAALGSASACSLAMARRHRELETIRPNPCRNEFAATSESDALVNLVPEIGPSRVEFAQRPPY
jgi:hypothetical protein